MTIGTLLLLMLSLFSGCVYIGTPQIASFQSTPETINVGEQATLIWAVVGAESVSINPDLGSVPLAGNRQVSPSKTTTYTITARNAIGTASSSLNVNVKPELNNSVSFTANPPRISAGGNSTLQWSAAGASSVNIFPDIGKVGSNGNRVISPSSTKTYTLTAIFGTRVITESVIVEVVVPPVVAMFTAFPDTLIVGETTLLRWNVTGANKVRIEPDVGEVPFAGNYGVMPSKTKTYVLTAQSDCCVVSKSVQVNITGALNPPPLYGPVVELFNVSPGSIYRGDAAILEWRVRDAISVSIDQGIGLVPASGAIVVSPTATTKYTLTVANGAAFYAVSLRLLVYER